MQPKSPNSKRFIKIIDLELGDRSDPSQVEPDPWKPSPIYAVDQEEGVAFLHAFLRGRFPFEEIPPFLIEEARGDNKVGTRFYIGGRIQGRTVIFSLNPLSQKIIRNSGIILAFPREDENKLYQWIDFHELGLRDVVDFNELIQSFRIDAQNLKVESWHGFERQIFLDYLGGRKEIEPHMLKEFWTWNFTRTDSFHIGMVRGKAVVLNNKEIRTSYGKELAFQPKVDEKSNTFLEIFLVNQEGEQKLIDRRIFHKGDTRLYRPAESTISPDEANEQLKRLLEN
ncbi:hypothetical protein HYU92_02805 [Candidatus Curtissbacteria bacterium]|nr:hypothetical protein [Candidatus Curtissbacteria bacterium]